MSEVALSCVEVMLVLSTVVASVVFLNYLSLFSEELALLVLIFILFSFIKLATADKTSPYSLNSKRGIFLVVKFPFDF